MGGIFDIDACAGKLNIRNVIAWNSWSNENEYIGQAVLFRLLF